MSDLIKRMDAINELDRILIQTKLGDEKWMYIVSDYIKQAARAIAELSTAELEPKHGRWKKIASGTSLGIVGSNQDIVMCTICRGVQYCKTKYCPDCGAKMEVEDAERDY